MVNHVLKLKGVYQRVNNRFLCVCVTVCAYFRTCKDVETCAGKCKRTEEGTDSVYSFLLFSFFFFNLHVKLCLHRAVHSDRSNIIVTSDGMWKVFC